MTTMKMRGQIRSSWLSPLEQLMLEKDILILALMYTFLSEGQNHTHSHSLDLSMKQNLEGMNYTRNRISTSHELCLN